MQEVGENQEHHCGSQIRPRAPPPSVPKRQDSELGVLNLGQVLVRPPFWPERQWLRPRLFAPAEGVDVDEDPRAFRDVVPRDFGVLHRHPGDGERPRGVEAECFLHNTHQVR